MRPRYLILALCLILATVLAACGLAPSQPPTPVVVTKTPRPTYTPTKSVAVSIKAVATATSEPTATAVPPTAAAPTAAATVAPTTPVEPMLLANDTANVRSGPGTNYPRIGQLTKGQQAKITGKNAAGDWWEFSFGGGSGWVAASMVSANEAAAGVQVAARIPQPPAAPTAAPRPVQPPAQPVAPPAQAPAAKAFAANGLDYRPPSTNPRITVWCRVFNSARSGFVGGTLRILRGGAQVGGDAAFDSTQSHGDPGMASQFKYNTGCKIELPLAEGGYTAVLVQGGQVVSDPQAFNVAGNNREFIVVFQQR